MTIRLSLLALLCSCPAASLAQEGDVFRYPEGRTNGARLEYVDDTPVMFLSGSPEDLGRQQAELVGRVIGPLAQMPKKAAEELGAARQWPLLVFAANALMRQAPPDHVRELNALVRLGGLDHGALTVGNGLIELRRMGGCASFVVMPEKSRSGKLLFGRNFDFPDFGVLDKYHCVMVVRPTGKHAFVSVGYPGLVGVVTGINDAGLAVATLDVYRSADGSPMFNPQGCPLALTFRRILEECTSIAEAQKLLEQTPRTTWMNLVVCSPRGARIFELTPENVGVRSAEEGILSCTNHFRVEGMCTDKRCWRYSRLTKLRESIQSFDVAAVHRAMHEVNQGRFTLQTMVIEPADMKLHIVMGGTAPVSARPLKTLDLKPWLTEQPETSTNTASP